MSDNSERDANKILDALLENMERRIEEIGERNSRAHHARAAAVTAFLGASQPVVDRIRDVMRRPLMLAPLDIEKFEAFLAAWDALQEQEKSSG